jgi:hypothetical protein
LKASTVSLALFVDEDHGKWYVSIIDVIGILTESENFIFLK